LSSALGIKTITLMADTPLVYGDYSSNMFPIIPDGENTVTHNTLGKERINSQKIIDKFIEIVS
jgi:heptosyltransferase-2